MQQLFNFCAGPATLPVAVLQRAQQEMLDWQGTGISVMEISHRSQEYQALANKAESDLRQLLAISDDYAVLFLHGGASLQFSNIPMTLLSAASKNDRRSARYLVNGVWSKKASEEAARYAAIEVTQVRKTNADGHYYLDDDIADSVKSQQSSLIYTHFTPNETIEGMRFNSVPQTSSPLIADMSSCILSEVIEVDQYDLIYAGAQKNIGPAGLCIVIVKREFFEKMTFTHVPKILNYQLQDQHKSMLNTPPTYAWYLASLVFEWLLEQGGVAAMQQLAIERAEHLYRLIDEDDFYGNSIAMDNRSRMNIPFSLPDESLNETFLKQAKQHKLLGLKGHRSVGGMRASLYNAMPMQGAECLVDFMRWFKQTYG